MAPPHAGAHMESRFVPKIQANSIQNVALHFRASDPRPQQNQSVMSRTKGRTVEDGFDGLLDTAFEQIRHYAVADIAVSLRLMRAFNDIASVRSAAVACRGDAAIDALYDRYGEIRRRGRSKAVGAVCRRGRASKAAVT